MRSGKKLKKSPKYWITPSASRYAVTTRDFRMLDTAYVRNPQCSPSWAVLSVISSSLSVYFEDIWSPSFPPTFVDFDRAVVSIAPFCGRSSSTVSSAATTRFGKRSVRIRCNDGKSCAGPIGGDPRATTTKKGITHGSRCSRTVSWPATGVRPTRGRSCWQGSPFRQHVAAGDQNMKVAISRPWIRPRPAHSSPFQPIGIWLKSLERANLRANLTFVALSIYSPSK